MIEVNSALDAVRTRLVKLVIEILGSDGTGEHAFRIDQQLSELGLTSLKMVNLMLAVEIEFDITIPQSDITPQNFHSVLSMQRMVERILPSP
ncbi:MAG TPA: phosphopantetheine-binding protein [Steroidobacteraceae bacterium]|nr:phosphopantetheine-binding protein [Steroidobacteraceae bacterium]